MSVRTPGSHRVGLAALVVCLVVGGPWNTSHAQDDSTESGSQSEESSEDAGKDRAEAPDKPRSRTKRAGEYSGTVPGHGTKAKRKRKNELSWVGFQPNADGSARIFLQLANELPFEQSVEGGVLTVHLANARYRDRNASRRLDVHFFGTALQMITSKRVSRRKQRGDKPARPPGIELRIQFKEGVAPRPARTSMKAEPDGYTYLYLDFDPKP